MTRPSAFGSSRRTPPQTIEKTPPPPPVRNFVSVTEFLTRSNGRQAVTDRDRQRDRDRRRGGKKSFALIARPRYVTHRPSATSSHRAIAP